MILKPIVQIGGCQKNKYMGKRIDLTGMRFGKLLVLKYSYTEDKKAYWTGKLAYGYSIEEAAKPKITKSSRKNSTIYILNGQPKTIKDLSDEFGINYHTLLSRLKRKKLSVDEAILI